MFKKIALSPLWALVTVAVIAGTILFNPVFLESVKLRYFDSLITSKSPTENNIYTVNIDEAALDRYGQWPFPRQIYANIIEDLYQRGAGIVVFNVLMPEADRSGGDSRLSSTMAGSPVVLPNVAAGKTKNQPRNPGAAVINSDYADLIVSYPGIIANIPVLENRAAGVGITNTMPEVDGVNRRLPLVVSVNGKLYPSIGLETLRVIAGDPNFQIKLNETGVEKLRIPKFGAIPTDDLGRVWIDWSQKNKSVSVTDLPQDLGGAVVIVGTAAAGLGNPVPSAVGAVWPQDLHAAVLGTVFNNVHIQRPGWADMAELAVFLTLSLTIIIISRWTYVGIATTILGISSYVVCSWWLFDSRNLLVDATAPTVGLLIVALHTYGVKFITEFLQKQQIKRQFGTYLSPALVAKLQKNPEMLQLGGDERELSIMFTDVRGFTTISEHYGKDVQGLTQIMNRYMTAMTAKIIENNGTLDKYIGDAQMAFWNAPVDEPRHAHQAVRTALAMMESLDEFNKEIEVEGVPPFGMGLGINTGVVVVGNMGSDQRFDYTCLGDHVNLASRLEGQSKGYGVKIILGQRTAELVRDEFSVVELDTIAVKGKTVGVRVYTVGTTVNHRHDQFLEAYYRGDWSRARKIAEQLKKDSGVTIQDYYDKMIERLDEGLPANWDGVYRATSK